MKNKHIQFKRLSGHLSHVDSASSVASTTSVASEDLNPHNLSLADELNEAGLLPSEHHTWNELLSEPVPK